ncbi:MAG: YebC/PmpR family DNA-binding transcriptional regulator [Salibacteraceae bacterium]
MSGHSKWSTIKRKKGALDAKRAKLFTRVLKEINVAVKDGGPDPEANPRLRLAIANAKGVNMPKDNVARAISKASDKDSESYQEVTYEGYAPGGIAIFVEATTDNLNRTVANVRAIFNKTGGSLGTNGSLEFLFDRKGVFTLEQAVLEGKDRDEFEMELIDGGAEEVEDQEDTIVIYTSFEDFGNMQRKLEELAIEAKSAELQRIPNSTNELDVDAGKKVLNIVERFEEDDDVNQVFHNLELTDELQAALEAE